MMVDGPTAARLRNMGRREGAEAERERSKDLIRAVEGLMAALDRAMDYIGNGWQPEDIVAEAREARDQAERFLAKARWEAK